jgi:flagellar motor switch protein FliM
MSQSTADKLSHEKIQRLLAAVGVESQEDTSHNIDATDYDWRQPRYFNLEQLGKIESFSETVAAECVEEFSRLYQADSRVSVVSTTERFFCEFKEETEQENYYILFGTDSQNPFGAVSIPNPSALVWTGQVLGSTEQPGNSDRDLSKLEESFLLDIGSGLIRAFSRAHGSELHPGKVIHDRTSVKLQGSEELFEILFEVCKSDSEEAGVKASFLICCDKLESVAGQTASRNTELSEAKIAGAILGHIHKVPVSVRVELGTVMLPFKDVMDLEVNDIVILNKKITDTVRVLVEDQTFFRGYPAQSAGQHAVVIASVNDLK